MMMDMQWSTAINGLSIRKRLYLINLRILKLKRLIIESRDKKKMVLIMITKAE